MILFNTFFSWKAKWAIFKERKNQTKGSESETVADFFQRRFHKEIVEYLVTQNSSVVDIKQNVWFSFGVLLLFSVMLPHYFPQRNHPRCIYICET